MSTIHFIWWGPYKEGLCVEMPNEIASNCKDHQVVFWCKEEFAEQFATHLALNLGNITWRSCSSIKDIVGGSLYNGPNKQWYDEAQDILRCLDSVRAYSAIKDLLSLIILHAKGGYYLDTTTYITPGTNGTNLSAKLNGNYQTPMVAKLAGGVSHQVGLQSAVAIILGKDGRAERGNISYSQQVDLIDVWAMYSPQLHDSLELMFISYVSRCNRMGLYPNGNPMNFDKQSGTEIMKEGLTDNNSKTEKANGEKTLKVPSLGITKVHRGTWRGQSNDRDDLIGNLIIRSVYDGLLVKCCNGDAAKLPSFCWPTQEL